jgi:hypothetical protein
MLFVVLILFPVFFFSPALHISRSALGRTQEGASETPPATTVIPPPPVHPTEDVPPSPSEPASPPPDQFPLPSVEIPVPPFRPVVPKTPDERTSDPSAGPKATEGPAAGPDKLTSSKPKTPARDTGKGPTPDAPKTVIATDAPRPKSKKLAGRPKAGTKARLGEL